MEVVRVFNNELSSLYEVKPPISKAKMTQITKSAIKGIKFYKHIVQSVEKFIQKCRPEYKVPGLYVVDSIVRQSRHQFGADKDVFGPRFVKNITTTFQNLFKCSEDDRPKIIRVLNLWQKNAVFPIDVIQPLLDMGLPNASNEWPNDASAEPTKASPANKSKEESRHKSSDSWKGWPQGNEEQVQDNKAYAEMSTKNLEKFNKAEMSNASKEDDASRSSGLKKVDRTPGETVEFNKKLLDFDYGDEEDEEEMKIEENHLTSQPNALALSMAQNLLSNPELLRQLQQMTATTMQTTEPLKDVSIPPQPSQMEDDASYPQDMQSSPQLSLIPPTPYQQPAMTHNLHISKSETDTDDRVLPEPPPLPTRDLDERSLASVLASHDRLLPSMCLPAFQQTGVAPKPPLPDKDDRILPDPTSMPPRDLDERSLASIIAQPDRAALPTIPYSENSNLMHFQYDKNGVGPYQTQPSVTMMDQLNIDAAYPAVMQPDAHLMQTSQGDEDERVIYSMPGEPPLPPQDFDERQIMMPVEENRSRKERSRSRSGSRNRGRSGRHRSRSRSPRRKRSRSRSRSRKNRSRSRERERIREKERERERERERRRKGIPPIKKGCVSVCSTTLWLGHVPKSCSEIDISDTFSPFGAILSIDMIPPRGCAYVVMDRRQDAHKALQKLKNLKLQGSSVKMAWAPGKGVKGKEFKEYWEVDLGVSYVPYDKIREDADFLDFLEEGGFIDEDSLPEHLKALRKQPDEEKAFNVNNKPVSDINTTYSEIQTAPNMVPPPIMPPTSVGLPMVLPHLMQPQFGLPIPGMLPPQAMVMQVPMGIPPPAPMLMVQQQSQGILGNQPLPIVGGVPQMVPRSIPPVTAALPNLKSAMPAEPVLPTSVSSSTAMGDATPTEEEGTNVSSPSVQITASGTVSLPTTPSSSAQSVASLAQFNSIMGLNANRPMLSVPPPVSTAGTPIPYPPPNVGFNFPPPGIRPPGQAHGMPPNAQFPWMQKQVGSPFADADSSQSAPSTPVRPVPPPQPGMPLHMYGNRPPFADPQTPSNMNSSPMKDVKNKDNKSNDVDNLDNRNSSHQDKVNRDMSTGTNDESSMDIDYSGNDMPSGPCFPGVPDFPRGPMNMQRMRGPPGRMPPGPRFPRGMPMGSPFSMRMGGPRGMSGPGMHGRMDMEFSPHHGPRGPRMPMGGPPGPHRNDAMHPGHDGRDWYPRDFEAPPYERDRERRFRDDWGREGREPWGGRGGDEADPRRSSRDMDDARRDDQRDPWNRDRTDNSRSSKDNMPIEKSESVSKPKDKPVNKSKVHKVLMDDLLKLRSYQRGGASFKSNRNEPKKDKPVRKESKAGNSEVEKTHDTNPEQSEKVPSTEQNTISRREKDREYRKRSRWGRTLSEEREFQEQRRNEIEMKFQSYEKSHAAQQPAKNSVETAGQNADDVSNINPDTQLGENHVDLPLRTDELPVQNEPVLQEQNVMDHIELNDSSNQNNTGTPSQDSDTNFEQNTVYKSPSNVTEAQTQERTEETCTNALDTSARDISEMSSENLDTSVHDVSEMATEHLDTSVHDVSEMATDHLDTSVHDVSEMAADHLDTSVHDISEMSAERLDTSAHDISEMAAEHLDTSVHDISEMAAERLCTSIHDISEMSAGHLDTSVHDISEMAAEHLAVTSEKNNLFDLSDSSDSNRIPQTESNSITSPKLTDSGEASVIENTPVCGDSDLVNSDITNSTANEATEDACMQNSSLVSTES